MSFEKAERKEYEEPRQIARGAWAKKRILADFHPDPRKQDEKDPTVEAEHQSILGQIRKADEPEIRGIQESMADAVIENPSLVADRHYIEKLQAAYERAQEIAGVRTLH